MYRIRCIWVGKTKEKYLQSGMELYQKKIKRYVALDVIELKPSSSSDILQAKKQETALIQNQLLTTETTYVLDQFGKDFTSIEFAQMLEQQKEIQHGHVNFIIGGAYGIDPSMLDAGYPKIRFSAMTFTHQMIRLFLLEQIYRAFTIMNHQAYHH